MLILNLNILLPGVIAQNNMYILPAYVTFRQETYQLLLFIKEFDNFYILLHELSHSYKTMKPQFKSKNNNFNTL